MLGRVTLYTLLAFFIVLSACDIDSTGRRESHPEKNLLKDYVNQPLDKANAVAGKVEERQAQTEKELESIGEDDDDSDAD